MTGSERRSPGNYARDLNLDITDQWYIYKSEYPKIMRRIKFPGTTNRQIDR